MFGPLKDAIFSKEKKKGQMNESLQSWMKNAGSIMGQVAQRRTLEQVLGVGACLWPLWG